MSEQSIKFTIGSYFKGAGFKQAQESIKNVNNAVKRSTGVLTQMTSTLGMMDSKFSKCANAITGMLGAISSGNPVLIATQATMTAVALVGEKMKKQADALNERYQQQAEYVKKMGESIRDAFSAEILSNIQSALDKITEIGTEFDRVTAAANEFTAHLNSIGTKQDAGTRLDMLIKQALQSREVRKEDKGIFEAKNAQKLVEFDNESKLKRNAEAAEMIEKKIEQVNSKRFNIEEQITVADETYRKNLEQLNLLEDKDIEMRKKLDEANQKLIEKKNQLIEEQNKLESKTNSLKQKQIENEQDKINIEKENKLARINAQNKVTDAYDEKATREAEETKKKDEERKKQIDELKKLLDSETKKLKDALDKQSVEGGGGGQYGNGGNAGDWNYGWGGGKLINQDAQNALNDWKEAEEQAKTTGLDKYKDRAARMRERAERFGWDAEKKTDPTEEMNENIRNIKEKLEQLGIK